MLYFILVILIRYIICFVSNTNDHDGHRWDPTADRRLTMKRCMFLFVSEKYFILLAKPRVNKFANKTKQRLQLLVSHHFIFYYTAFAVVTSSNVQYTVYVQSHWGGYSKGALRKKSKIKSSSGQRTAQRQSRRHL